MKFLEDVKNMVDAELHFGVSPRFYILCCYNELKKNEIVQLLKEQIEKRVITPLIIKDIFLNEISTFNFKSYNRLGYVEIQLEYIPLEEMKKIPIADQTVKLIEFSQQLELVTKGIEFPEEPEWQRTVENLRKGWTANREKFENDWETLQKDKEQDFFLDPYNPPYVVTIAGEVSEKNIDWEIAHKTYMKALDRWVEFYSGRFTDYNISLYEERVKQNLSNRKSEVHYIRVNSAFVFIEKDWWQKNAKFYMENYFIKQILRVKGLHFCYFVLNKEIDQSNDRILQESNPTIKLLEAELTIINNLNETIARIGDKLFKELIINRRTHSKNVLNTCLERFEIREVRDEVATKIERIKNQLKEKREIQQQKFNKQQKMWLLILNVLLGSSVLFSISDKLKEQLTTPNSFLLNIIGSGLSQSILGILDPVIWTFMIVVAIIAVGGLIIVNLVQKIGITVPFSIKK